MGVKPLDIVYYLFHPSELRAIIQWKTWHNPVHERDESKESDTLKRCFEFLNLTSRSFSMVIQELHPELLVPIALFYLILRALDTIEDDMTIPLEKKDKLLRDFHNIIEKEGWTFDGNGPDEKDRQLCVEFDVVITEFIKIKSVYRKIIRDITEKMGNGMADYANNAEHNKDGIETIKGYDLYCHYVAGLVGEGLTRLFVEAKLANPVLLERSDLHESMGLFLQKTNIIRDIREDFDDKRKFWPKEVWSKHVDNFEDLFDPKQLDRALNCSSELVLNALEHIPACLNYLAGIREQSVFNFCCIPQTMAIATLELVFQNPKIFKQNVKITKGQACRIMMDSTQNLRVACEVFRRYCHVILKKNNPKDPNFLQISVACSQAEQFIEKIFPAKDPKITQEALSEKEAAEKKRQQDEQKEIYFIMGAVICVVVVISAIMIGLAILFGARFDMAVEQVMSGNFKRPDNLQNPRDEL